MPEKKSKRKANQAVPILTRGGECNDLDTWIFPTVTVGQDGAGCCRGKHENASGRRGARGGVGSQARDNGMHATWCTVCVSSV